MGADMCISAIAIRSGAEPDWVAAEQAINALPAEMNEEVGMTFNIDEEDVAERLRAALEAVRLAVEGGNREATTIQFGEWRLLLSGGLSTGDSPTDLFDDIWMLDISGVADATGFSWPTDEAADLNKPPDTPPS